MTIPNFAKNVFKRQSYWSLNLDNKSDFNIAFTVFVAVYSVESVQSSFGYSAFSYFAL